MSRRHYLHLVGDQSGWPKGTVPTPALLARMDQLASELINGEEGGTWEPKTPIVLGGLGGEDGNPQLHLTTVGSSFTGDVETVRGNSLSDELGTPGILLENGQAPAFTAPITRDVNVPFTGFAETYDPGDAPRFAIDPLTFGVITYQDGNNTTFFVPLPIRARHRGATISQVQFRFRIPRLPYALPPTRPRFRVAKVVAGDVAPLHTAAGGYDADGYLMDTAATPGAYFNFGNTRTLTYVPNQNHVDLDPEDGVYIIQVRDAQGAAGSSALGNLFLGATVQLTNIQDMRQE